MITLSVKEIAEQADVHIDTIFKIKRGNSSPSPSLAKKLEKITGIDRLKWLYPDEFGSPWEKDTASIK